MASVPNGSVRADTWQGRLAVAAARLRADVVFAVVDAGLIVVAYSAALVLRFVDLRGVTPNWWRGFAISLPLIVITHLLSNFLLGGYGHVWEYASVEEAMRLVAAALVSAMALFLAVLAYRSLSGQSGPVPLMVLAVGAMLTLGGMGAVRFRSRLFSFRRNAGAKEPARTIVVGTDQTAVDLARRGRRGDHPVAVLGFVSTEPAVPSVRLAGLPVLGTIDDLRSVVSGTPIDQVVVAGSAGDEVVRRVVDTCMDVDVRLRILPDMREIMSSNGGMRDLRELRIEDLLPRPVVSTDMTGVRSLVSGQTVLVTGAGGSIGAEIVHQVLALDPALVVCVDHDESHLHEAMLKWRSTRTRPVLCDVRDREQLMQVFAEHHPAVIFHAAAHKHVPILESAPEEAVKTNIIGTVNMLDAAHLNGAKRFIFVSTDKAVKPRNVMGASKRAAEMMIQVSTARDNGCIHAAVRFGNVLGSRGSVVPTFAYQILNGGPVTISDPEMKRYFMTTSEAVQLVLQSAAVADEGDVLVLDMGAPVKIVDLARRMIRLAGLVPGRDISIEITGARLGEKLREELSTDPLMPSGFPKINVSRPPCPDPTRLFEVIVELERLASRGDRSAIRDTLFSLTEAEWPTEPEPSLRLFDYADVVAHGRG